MRQSWAEDTELIDVKQEIFFSLSSLFLYPVNFFFFFLKCTLVSEVYSLYLYSEHLKNELILAEVSDVETKINTSIELKNYNITQNCPTLYVNVLCLRS